MEGRKGGGGIIFNVSLQGTILCLKDGDCGSLEFCCPDGYNGSQCCERSASVRALWIMGVFLFLAIILCLVILVRSRTNYLSCDRSNRDFSSPRSVVLELSPALTALRGLPPPYSSKPLSDRELLTLQRQAMQYRAIAQQTLAPVTENILSEYGQWAPDSEQQQQQQNQNPNTSQQPPHQQVELHLPCYHDIRPPTLEETGMHRQRLSAEVTLQEEELVYQSDSLSDESEPEYSRHPTRKYSACDAMLPSRFHQNQTKMARKVVSQSHDGCTLEFNVKPGATKPKESVARRFFTRSTSASPDVPQLPQAATPMSPTPYDVPAALLSTPDPPRRNRSWSTSSVSSPFQQLDVIVDVQPNDYPARPHTSMGCLSVPPDYTPNSGKQQS